MSAVALKNLAEIERNGVAPEQIGGGTRYLGLEHIESGGRILGSETVETGDLASTKFRFTPDHLLFGKLRPYLAKIALPDFAGICSTDILPVRPGPELDRRYLAFFLRQPSIVDLASSRATGANLPRLSPKALGEIEIPWRPLPEQRRIAAILDQADALRRLRRRSLSRLSDLGRAIFFEMFGDAATNPQDWPIVKLGDVCGVGSSKRVFVSEFTESGVPFYRGTEVGQLGAGKTIDPELFIDRDHYESLIQESGRPAVGDLLLPSICHDGRIWLVDHDLPFYFKDGRVLWIKSAQANIDGEYLRRHLQGLLLRDYNKIASGTTFAELKIVNLKGLKILYPPLALQKQFARRVSSLEGARRNMLDATDKSEALFNSLQHRAFRGEL